MYRKPHDARRVCSYSVQEWMKLGEVGDGRKGDTSRYTFSWTSVNSTQLYGHP